MSEALSASAFTTFRLALDVANLVDAQVKVIGDLPGQPMGIPSIQDRLLDDRPLLICQFLCHVTKLGIDRAQEKEKGMGLHVWVGVAHALEHAIIFIAPIVLCQPLVTVGAGHRFKTE